MDYKCYKIYEQEATNLLNGLRIAECMNVYDFDNKFENNEENIIPYNLKELAVSDVLTCSYCNVSFENASGQRNHYKLDWHRYNLKRALSGNKSVAEEVFDNLAGDISSLSGSDSEGTSDDSDTDVSESKKLVSENFRPKFRNIRHTKIFFENHDTKILSLYRCLLQNKKETVKKNDLVKRACDLIEKPKKWMVVMLGGGHFAAAIFDNGNIVNHKTFHCYTVRAKQGGSQSSRDNKGGNHPKSAGASLRRYNEQALIQHVQEIMGVWSEPIKQCGLILYRATGPYNRGVLFGGKNPILSKTDQRLRNIPFPTRRATFKEVKRVYDMLSSLELYGLAEDFKDKFPRSPDKRVLSPKAKDAEMPDSNLETSEKIETVTKKKASPEKSQSKERAEPQREIPGQDIQSPSESSSDDLSEYEMFSNDIEVSFQDLQEFEDTVPQHIKDMKKKMQQKKKRKKLIQKQKMSSEKKKWMEEFERLQGNFVKSCESGNKELLEENLNFYHTLPNRDTTESEENKKLYNTFTKEDFMSCLNAPINEDNKNTVLHLAALLGRSDYISTLLTAGADPTIKNKSKLTPYVIAADKETRNTFRSFAANFPDKYDFKKANIPEPLNEEQEKELEEKKKEKRKLKRIKEKIKKQEEKEKKVEEKEKERFLALSDREKCALAAERRFVASSTANVKSSKPIVLSRCFQCGVDITGKVPFEYGNNRFCTIVCLKSHRSKTNCYGKEI